MTTCRACECTYKAPYTRRVLWCDECQAKGKDVVLTALEEEVADLSQREGAYMSLVYDTKDWERWCTLINAYHAVNGIAYPIQRQARLTEFDVRISQTVKKGGVFGDLVSTWWRRLRRQNDLLALDWEIFNAELIEEGRHAVPGSR